MTSSCVTVQQPTADPIVFNEMSWNEAAVHDFREVNVELSLLITYRVSKTLPEAGELLLLRWTRSESAEQRP